MDLQYNIDELRKAANYLMLRARLRPSGIGAIIFGLLAVLASLPGPKGGNPSMGLLALGLFLLIEGIWCLASPSPAAILLNGVALALVGVWNIWISISPVQAFWIVMGALQLRWAWQRYQEFQLFSKMAADVPSDEAVRYFDPILKELKGNRPQDPSRVTFVLKNQPWLGKLLMDGAVFVRAGGQGILMARKDEVSFVQTGEVSRGKLIKVSAQIGTNLGEGTMAPADLSKIDTWKAYVSGQPAT